MNGMFYKITPQGGIRASYLVLLEQELYIYSSKDSKSPEHVIILKPGAYPKKRSPIQLKPA